MNLQSETCQFISDKFCRLGFFKSGFRKLMQMLTQVEAARANARRMAMYNLANPMNPSVVHAVAAKCFSTETATRVASDAMQIFGGYGLAKEYPIEKIFRDARAGMIEDGVNEALAIKATEFM